MSVTPVPAATLILVRDTPEGPQVLLQQRSATSRFVAGAWVFPGGRLDADDHAPAWESHGLCPLSARRQLSLREGSGLAYWVAAVRESFEEAGVLLARRADRPDAPPADADTLDAWRQSMMRGDMHFAALCQRERLILDLGKVAYVNHWITPANLPIRYDTRFFIARLPDGQQADHRHFEAVDTRWVSPDEALCRCEAGEFKLILPTLVSLQAMRGQIDCAGIIRALARPVPEETP
jgi:8-oxo-dGTP pyrophosphatase MutT (NUDIX family)